MCRYKYVLGANDRKMQKGNSNSANNVLVAPRDHFLDNAGMSDSDSDQEAVEEGMLIEAPVTPAKPLPGTGTEGSRHESAQADQMADGDHQLSRKADLLAEGSDHGCAKADQIDGVVATTIAMTATPQVGFHLLPDQRM